jgi:membrane-associated protease RseP (regulator of RpoE activity)
MHFVIALVLVLFGSFAIGQVAESSPALAKTSDCVASGTDQTCGKGDAVQAPAKAAGVQPGDVVISIDGKKVKDASDFVRTVRKSAGEPLVLSVLRAGKTVQLTVLPVPVDRPSLADENKTERVGAIGVTVQRRLVTEHQGFMPALKDSGTNLKFMVTSFADLAHKLGTITKVYSSDRDPTTFVGPVGGARISGEVLASDTSLGVRLLQFVLLISSLNLVVGVFNLLPLLPLDGGHVAGALVEGAKRGRARLKARRAPAFGPDGEPAPARPQIFVDTAQMLPVMYAVASVLILLTLLTFYADIVKPVNLFGG